jgi:IS1 family transposase
MNRMDTARRAQVIRCLVEGNSINSTVRMTGVAKNTVLKLLVEMGEACSSFLDLTMRNLPCERLQADEAWSFVYAKQKNVKPEHFEADAYAGDVWTWVAIDADTKLIPCWCVGGRDTDTAQSFIEDLASRLSNRVQLTTDGLKAYLTAVKHSFGNEIDYAQLHKIYGDNTEGQKRYSPAVCTGCEKKNVTGSPDPRHISTSYIERQNLTMRMSMRRFTRLTNGFSKKIENHVASVALYMMYYNFGRKHQTLLGRTPAMAAGIANHVWSIEEIISLLTSVEPKATRPAKKAVSN